jgi:cell division protein FtsB
VTNVAGLPASIEELQAENESLRATVAALRDRVENAVDEQGSAFSWFQAAASLEETIR